MRCFILLRAATKPSHCRASCNSSNKMRSADFTPIEAITSRPFGKARWVGTLSQSTISCSTSLSGI